MKRIKIILLCCVVFILSCKKTIPFTPESPTSVEFFSLPENKVKNGDVININLTTVGTYTLTMIDTVTNLVEIQQVGTTSAKDAAKAFGMNWLFKYPRPVHFIP